MMRYRDALVDTLQREKNQARDIVHLTKNLPDLGELIAGASRRRLLSTA
jgi:hypothetical protein